MVSEQRAAEAPSVEERLDRLYAELAELKKQVILGRVETELVVHRPTDDSLKAWHDLVAAAKDVSALWQGPDAVGEIREQRGS